MFPSIYLFSIAANVLRKLDFPDPSPENTKLPNHTDYRHLKFFLLYLFTLVFISSIELILQVSSYFIPQAYYLLKRISPNLSIFFIMYSPIKHFSVLNIILTIRGLSIPYFLQNIFHFRVCFHHAYLLLLVSFPCNIFSLRSFYSFILFTL